VLVLVLDFASSLARRVGVPRPYSLAVHPSS
jgi:hypothetical protein